MNDDTRSPFEKAAGLEGPALAEYRASRDAMGMKDPKVSVCPECGNTIIGKCPYCEEVARIKRDAEIKKWKDGEAARHGTAPGNLAAKVKAAADARVQEPVRSGAECAYPND